MKPTENGFWIDVSYLVLLRFHKDTFQPDTGVRTCILFLRKPEDGEMPREDYNIFMAMSQRIGQDSKGNSVFVLDGNGNSTGVLNHDLNEIAERILTFYLATEHQKIRDISLPLRKVKLKTILTSILNTIRQS